MNEGFTDAHKLQDARFDDCLRMAERGELVCGNFLTPAEITHLERLVKERGVANRVFFFGGYADAERRRACFLPSYIAELDGERESLAQQFFPDEFPSHAIKITGSGFGRELTHRACLGACLALGIERHTIGDIVIKDGCAVVFCTDKIAEFLISDLDRVGADKVTVDKFSADADFCADRKFSDASDTVASDRFDCVVASLTKLSRERAQALIKSGVCEIDYAVCDRPDKSVPTPCTVSLRGYGKFKILCFDGQTKKGRLRLKAQKYV